MKVYYRVRERAGYHIFGDDLPLSGSQFGLNHSTSVLMGFDSKREAEREERERQSSVASLGPHWRKSREDTKLIQVILRALYSGNEI